MFRTAILTLLLALVPAALADDSPYFEPVVQLFSGLSGGGEAMMRDAATDDFILLEHGEVWGAQEWGELQRG